MRIKFLQSKLLTVFGNDWCLSDVASKTATSVAILIAGSYPWVRYPNDIDIVFILDNQERFQQKSIIRNPSFYEKALFAFPSEWTIEIVGIETIRKAAQGEGFPMAKIVRRKIVAWFGVIPLAGIDVYMGSEPPLENFIVLHDDLMTGSRLAKWRNIREDAMKIMAKREWRRNEANALAKWIQCKRKKLNGFSDF